MNTIKRMVITAICVAMCVVLPIAFHSIPNAGTIFLPMHIPVLLCGLLCGWPYGFICGLLGPFLSSFTGMPPLAMLPGMMVECATYGLVCGLMMRYLRTGKLTVDLYCSMIPAMIMGRVISGLAKSLIFNPGVAPFAWVTTSLVTGIPGIVIQLVIMPILVISLTKAKLIPNRYPEKACHA